MHMVYTDYIICDRKLPTSKNSLTATCLKLFCREKSKYLENKVACNGL